MSYWLQLCIVCPLLFLAGFADSVAGGGGTISVPALMLIGLPGHMALGTNKMVMSIGTLTSVYRFGKSGRIVWKTALSAMAGSFLGASLGAKLALLIDDTFMNYLLAVMLPVIAVFLAVNKSFGREDTASAPAPSARLLRPAALCGAAVGVYDGFFGPGTGTFYIMLFTLVLKLTLTEASADAKVANFGSNVGALFMFLLNGSVAWPIALPGLLFTISGNWVGSTLSIKNGARFIRPVMICILTLLLIKTVISFF